MQNFQNLKAMIFNLNNKITFSVTNIKDVLYERLNFILSSSLLRKLINLNSIKKEVAKIL